MIKEKKTIFLAIGAVCLLLILLLMVRSGKKERQEIPVVAPTAPIATALPADKGQVEHKAPAATEAHGGVATERRVPEDEGQLIDDAEMEKVVGALNAMLDDDDTEGILKEARLLRKHPDADVRDQVAFAFNWVGVQALPDLTMMLDDPDPEVEDSVRTYWRDTLAEVENELDRADMLGAAAEVYGDTIDTEFLDDLIMEFSMLDDEVALPKLVEILNRIEDKDCVDMLVEAIDSIVQSDEDITTKADAIREAALYQVELEQERLEEHGEIEATAEVLEN